MTSNRQFKRHGHFTIWRFYVAWGHRDGLHIISPTRHFHVFVWFRGQRRNPLYVKWERV